MSDDTFAYRSPHNKLRFNASRYHSFKKRERVFGEILINNKLGTTNDLHKPFIVNNIHLPSSAPEVFQTGDVRYANNLTLLRRGLKDKILQICHVHYALKYHQIYRLVEG